MRSLSTTFLIASILLEEIGPWHGMTRVSPLRIVVAPDPPSVVTSQR